jgi:hypothetical protein
MAEVRQGHRESQVKGPYFLLLTPQRVINCFIITLFSQCFDRTWTEPMILDIKGKQALNACTYMYVFLINVFVCICVCLGGFFVYVFELSRSSSNACLAILHRTVTQTCWLSMLQSKTEGYIGNNVIKYNTVISILMQYWTYKCILAYPSV